MLNILIVDDHMITRMGLKVLMKDVLPAHTVDEAETGNDAMLLVKEKSYDLCLMDLNIPKTDSLEMIKRFKVMKPEMKILVVSMNNEDVYALNVLKNGAMGFVSKANGYNDIKSAILKVLENKKFMSENVISLLIESESEKLESNPFNRLSERELEISKLICEGHPTKMIAFKTNLQLSTISTYKAKIFEKLQVRNTIELFELSKVHMLLGN
jgi:two-component system invasion response regulator UvrY